MDSDSAALAGQGAQLADVVFGGVLAEVGDPDRGAVFRHGGSRGAGTAHTRRHVRIGGAVRVLEAWRSRCAHTTAETTAHARANRLRKVVLSGLLPGTFHNHWVKRVVRDVLVMARNRRVAKLFPCATTFFGSWVRDDRSAMCLDSLCPLPVVFPPATHLAVPFHEHKDKPGLIILQ